MIVAVRRHTPRADQLCLHFRKDIFDILICLGLCHFTSSSNWQAEISVCETAYILFEPKTFIYIYNNHSTYVDLQFITSFPGKKLLTEDIWIMINISKLMNSMETVHWTFRCGITSQQYEAIKFRSVFRGWKSTLWRSLLFQRYSGSSLVFIIYILIIIIVI